MFFSNGSVLVGKFVNGVLGSVYKELGEPGKDSAPKKKKKIYLNPKTGIQTPR